MKLTVKERLVLLGILPNEGDFLTLKLVRKLRESLSFNEQEHKLYKFVQKENSISWNDKVQQDKEVEIGEKSNDLIVQALKKLNDQKKLHEEHFDIYEKFVGVG